MLRIRRDEERGRFDYGWLDTRHTFSFGDYYDPAQMGFRSLRVLNDDRVAPAAGFPTHFHRQMEIVTYVVDGALEHEDSTGSGGVIRPGDVQRMSAGTGVMHSEYNHSKAEPVRFLQIWLVPGVRVLPPSYEQATIDREEMRGSLRLLGSRDGRDGSVTIHQDVDLYAALLAGDQRAAHRFVQGRHGWLQVVRGRVRIGDDALNEGDGVAISEEDEVSIAGVPGDGGHAEVLLFDLA
jgi:quercetin 2,3-dioxygenase